MSNKSFDLNNIVYASQNSKITLKTKEKLDELAAQVALWDSEGNSMSDNKENKLANSSKPPIVNNRKVLGILNSSNPDNSFSPSRANSRKSFLDINGAVKAKKAFFEGLITGNSNDNQTIKTLKPVKNLELPGVFSSYKSNNKLENIIISTITEECENYSEDLHIPTVDLEVFNEELDESLPSPPPSSVLHDLSNSFIDSVDSFSHNNNNNISIDSQLTNNVDLNETTTQFNNSSELIDDISQDLTRVSSLESSSITGSFYDDFINEYAKISHDKNREKDIESLPGIINQEQPKKIRRSLSFSDKVKYIEPSSEDESSINKNNANTNSSDNSSLNYNQSSLQYDESSDDVSDKKSYDEMFQDTLVGELMQKSYLLIDDLKKFSSNPDYKPGCLEHLKRCLSIVRNNLKYASCAESVHYKPLSINEIICDANLYNLQLNIKEEYVFIDYRSLIKFGNMDKMKKLSTLFHVVLMGRSEAGTVIYESNIYSFVKRSEANKLGLKFQDRNWLEFLEKVNFSVLRSGFKLIFDLYCMTLIPNKFLSASNGTPRRRTPIKKLFVDSPAKGVDSPVILTNIGTFRLSQSDMICDNDNDNIEKRIILPQNCPFVGDVQLTGSLSFHVSSEFQGRLNIFMEIGGVGSWAFRDCKVTYKGIVGGRISETTKEIEDIDVEILFCAFKGPASLCDFHVCARANSFSVLLDESSIKKRISVNRRLSTDGEKKCRFLAAAESIEDAHKWCEWINICHKSFMEWSNLIPLI